MPVSDSTHELDLILLFISTITSLLEDLGFDLDGSSLLRLRDTGALHGFVASQYTQKINKKKRRTRLRQAHVAGPGSSLSWTRPTVGLRLELLSQLLGFAKLTLNSVVGSTVAVDSRHFVHVKLGQSEGSQEPKSTLASEDIH